MSDKQNDNIPLNSEELSETIANKVYEKIAGTFLEFMTNIEKGQKAIALNVEHIKERLEIAEKKAETALGKAETAEKKTIEKDSDIELINERLNRKRKAIAELREDFEVYKRHLKLISEIEPTLKTIQSAFSFWTRKNWLKIAGIVIGILFIAAAFIVGITIFMHKKGIVTFIDGSKHSNIEQIYDNIREGKVNPTVRGGSDYKMTEIEIDTMMAQQERILIKPISGMKRY